mmetsp:Transcript_3145/g.4650  ORF Transcript_3145/g.4650 Transcript_3145/m.4650 type:complete len:349 (+) Transcript_3145:128-1174(+)
MVTNFSDLVHSTVAYKPNSRQNIIIQLNDFINIKRVPLQAVVDTYDQQRLIRLNGVVPMEHKGKKYRIPIDMWIVPNFPYEPPICVVVPTPEMSIAEKHPFVQSATGRVYCTYTANWHVQRSTLIGLFHELSKIFSQRSPVFAKPRSNSIQGGGHMRHSQPSRPPTYHNQPYYQQPSYNHPPHNMSRTHSTGSSNEKLFIISSILKEFEKAKNDGSVKEAEVQRTKAQLQQKKSQTEQNAKKVESDLNEILSTKERLDKSVQELSLKIEKVKKKQENQSIDDITFEKTVLMRIEKESEVSAYEDLILNVEDMLLDSKIDFDSFEKTIRDLYKKLYMSKAQLNKVKTMQ